MFKILSWMVLGLVSALVAGCALQYVDRETGTTHLYGFGHMRVRVPPSNEGKSAVYTGVDTLGLGVGLGSSQRYLTAGWCRNTELLLYDDASLRLEWPSRDPFDIHFGSLPPFKIETETTETAKTGKE